MGLGWKDGMKPKESHSYEDWIPGEKKSMREEDEAKVFLGKMGTKLLLLSVSQLMTLQKAKQMQKAKHLRQKVRWTLKVRF